jgi:hypothetical protein
MYGVSKIQSQWPDSESLRNAKREYAKDIGNLQEKKYLTHLTWLISRSRKAAAGLIGLT